MIACIEGVLREKSVSSATIFVNGIGYELFVPSRYLSKYSPGEKLFFYTFHRLKEDVSELYAFPTKQEKEFFEVLISVSGVGPKTALALLEFPVSHLHRSVEEEDLSFLTKTPGLGKKTASRLILELKGKLPETQKKAEELPSKYSDISSMLKSLGFLEIDIEKKLSTLPKEVSQKSEEEIIKYMLKTLSSS